MAITKKPRDGDHSSAFKTNSELSAFLSLFVENGDWETSTRSVRPDRDVADKRTYKEDLRVGLSCRCMRIGNAESTAIPLFKDV